MTRNSPETARESAHPAPGVYAPDQLQGRCGAEAPRIVDGPAAWCRLTAGHDGWHKADDGSEWNDTGAARRAAADAACAALVAASAQLRDDAMHRTRDRLLVDVLAVDLLAVAAWLDRRAWLLAVDPGAVVRLVDGFDAASLDDDDELLPLDGSPPAFVTSRPPEPVPVDGPCCRAQVTAGADSGQHEPGCPA